MNAYRSSLTHVCQGKKSREYYSKTDYNLCCV